MAMLLLDKGLWKISKLTFLKNNPSELIFLTCFAGLAILESFLPCGLASGRLAGDWLGDCVGLINGTIKVTLAPWKKR